MSVDRGRGAPKHLLAASARIAHTLGLCPVAARATANLERLLAADDNEPVAATCNADKTAAQHPPGCAIAELVL